jgi:tRNA-uridine 2-sulfurtransferase
LKKDTVRALARKYRLNTAEKPESQDICFVPDRDYKKFIRERLGAEAFKPGPFKNPDGQVIGQHQGIMNYTIGQRERLGIALGYPVYVYRIDTAENTVCVGPQEFLYASGLWAGQLNWLVAEKSFDEKEVAVQIRYNAEAIKGRLTLAKNHRVRVDFDEPQKSVTPGQSVVFYSRDVVLGGGIIESAI